jgi:cation transport regulator
VTGNRGDGRKVSAPAVRLIMPYSTIEDLPLPVRRALPQHAQSIYLQAFNHAWEQYGTQYERESIAHRVAWAAVKRNYQKIGQAWVAIEAS